MKIHTVSIRRFRSLEHAELTACGGLNVMIGKNNSGKSNLMGSIDLVHRHLSRGSLAAPWSTARPIDEFTDREFSRPIQIGIEFDFPDDLNTQLREQLRSLAPQLDRSIDQLEDYDHLSIIVSGMLLRGEAFLWVQDIGAGPLDVGGDDLKIDGIPLLHVSGNAAAELNGSYKEAEALKKDQIAVETMLRERNRLDYLYQTGEPHRFYYGQDISPTLSGEILQFKARSSDIGEFVGALEAWHGGSSARIDAIEHRPTTNALTTYAGATTTPPAYAIWLMKLYGEIQMLHLRERREAIGRAEAEALLDLKVTRGGPERLVMLQSTVRSLLGVNVDAFQSESPRRAERGPAEIDIDRFLIDANGAGVREALRLVLDLELRAPDIVLIEEPEVHLHPGLEHAVYQYLRDKSQEIQMFVTTHSTSFVDSVSFQNIYLISKGKNQRTTANTLDTGGALQIPAELGLRLSTVFMYDRLIFVEGPSDEAVLRELCKTSNIDLANANVGFVQMGGVRNFAHFAAHATLDLLTRRQVKMWFITDRDERDDNDVANMLQRLGQHATLCVLQRRELENYLLDPEAVTRLISDKASKAGRSIDTPKFADALQALSEEAVALRDEVVRLRMTKAVLKSVHLTGRQINGDFVERLEYAIHELEERKAGLADTKAAIEAELDDGWDHLAEAMAPGTAVLERVLRRYDLAFSKEGGDSARLARLIAPDSIPTELLEVLRDVVA